MRLVASVRRVTGSTTHSVAQGSTGAVQLEPAMRVEISQADGGFLLIRYSAQGFAGDTWHATVDEAKRQAEVEYEIAQTDWAEEPGA